MKNLLAEFTAVLNRAIGSPGLFSLDLRSFYVNSNEKPNTTDPRRRAPRLSLLIKTNQIECFLHLVGRTCLGAKNRPQSISRKRARLVEAQVLKINPQTTSPFPKQNGTLPEPFAGLAYSPGPFCSSFGQNRDHSEVMKVSPMSWILLANMYRNVDRLELGRAPRPGLEPGIPR
jgi:hypothetical protein